MSVYKSPLVFGTITAHDETNRCVKIAMEPFGEETGWCRVLKDTFYPIPPHLPHVSHPGEESAEQAVDVLHEGQPHSHERHSPHIPKWPYEVGMEVLAAMVQGTHGAEQCVVLGPLDDGELDPDEDERLLRPDPEDDAWGKL